MVRAPAAEAEQVPGIDGVTPPSEPQLPGGFPSDVPALLARCADNELVELPQGGLVLRSLLKEAEQRVLFEYIWTLAADSPLLSDLRDQASARVPVPIMYWNHPYSRACSVARRPAPLLRWAERLLQALVPETLGLKVDSLLAQAYFSDAGLGVHLDRDLSWGLGLSLGAGARMEFYHHGNPFPEVVELHSGDLVIAEFGRMLHSIDLLERGTAPEWWRQLPCPGVVRGSILFRQALSEEEQRSLSEPRAEALFGMSLDDLMLKRAMTLGECALFLRHEMDAFGGGNVG